MLPLGCPQLNYAHSLWGESCRNRLCSINWNRCCRFDDTLALTVNGYCKAELVREPEHLGPWKTIEELELVALD